MEQCVFCESSSNLNTQLTITLDNGSKIIVKICDVHADDATVKSARTAYLDKKQKIEAIIAQAKAMGLSVSESPSGISLATKANVTSDATISTRPQKEAKKDSQDELVMAELVNESEIKPKPKIIPPKDANVISTKRLDNNKFSSTGGNVQGTSVGQYSGYDVSSLSDKLPDDATDGFAEMTVVEGRGGQPLAIPQKRVDGTGVTRITIIKGEDDNKLQNRFKKMAQDSMSDRIPDFAKAGYSNTTRACPICRGSGTIKQKEEGICPKCGGNGFISIY